MWKFVETCSVNVPCTPVFEGIADSFCCYRRFPVGCNIENWSPIYVVKRFINSKVRDKVYSNVGCMPSEHVIVGNRWQAGQINAETTASIVYSNRVLPRSCSRYDEGSVEKSVAVG